MLPFMSLASSTDKRVFPDAVGPAITITGSIPVVPLLSDNCNQQFFKLYYPLEQFFQVVTPYPVYRRTSMGTCIRVFQRRQVGKQRLYLDLIELIMRLDSGSAGQPVKRFVSYEAPV